MRIETVYLPREQLSSEVLGQGGTRYRAPHALPEAAIEALTKQYRPSILVAPPLPNHDELMVALSDKGYCVANFDFTDLSKSDCFNPLCLLRGVDDFLYLARALFISGTGERPEDSRSAMAVCKWIETCLYLLFEEHTYLLKGQLLRRCMRTFTHTHASFLTFSSLLKVMGECMDVINEPEYITRLDCRVDVITEARHGGRSEYAIAHYGKLFEEQDRHLVAKAAFQATRNVCNPLVLHVTRTNELTVEDVRTHNQIIVFTAPRPGTLLDGLFHATLRSYIQGVCHETSYLCPYLTLLAWDMEGHETGIMMSEHRRRQLENQGVTLLTTSDFL